MSERASIYRDYAPLYEAAGFSPRPVRPGTKAPPIPKWNRLEEDITPVLREQWRDQFGDCGIGLVMGTRFPDGTTLGAVDVDHDDYVRIAAAALGDPPSGRIGKKGIVHFVRVAGTPKYLECRVKGPKAEGYGKVAEFLFGPRFCVLPPTLHPDTAAPYRWIGKPLLDTHFEELPIVEM